MSDELAGEKDRETALEKGGAARKRKLAVAVVIVSVLGLLALSGALTAILQWLLGAAFIAGLIGAGWYLIKKPLKEAKAARAEKKTKQVEAEAARDQRRSVEEQLAELKRKKSQSDP